MLNHIPQLHLVASIEEHFVDICDRVNYSSEFSILKLSFLDDLASLSVECQELALFAQ